MPPTIFAGEPFPRSHLNAIAGLFENGVLQAERKPRDTTHDFIVRALRKLASTYPDIHVHIELGIPAWWERIRSDDPRQVYDTRLPITIRNTNTLEIDVGHFDRAMRRLDPALIAALLRSLSIASQFTLDIVGPGDAFGMAEYTRFLGCVDDWYEQIKEEAAIELQIEPGTLSNQALRRYFRDYHIQTPGLIRRRIGRHHDPMLSRKQKMLSLDACEARINRLPTAERRVALALVETIGILKPIKRSLEKSRQLVDRPLWADDDLAHFPVPAFIVETDSLGERIGITCELFDEMWQDAAQASNGEMAPNYAFSIRGDAGGTARVQHVLDAIASATRAAIRLADVIASYEKSHEH